MSFGLAADPISGPSSARPLSTSTLAAPSSLATPPWATPPESLAVDRFGATGRSSRPSRRSETSRHASPLGTSNSFYLVCLMQRPSHA